MFVLRSPSESALLHVIASCADRPPNHPLLETADLAAPPPGFEAVALGSALGRGDDAWRRARLAIDQLAMYPPAWTSAHAAPGPIAAGVPLVSVIEHFGFHSILPGRVRETFDTDGPEERYGFSFLTLAGHAEQGVERFTVRHARATGHVAYEIASISRPTGLARLGAPVARALQHRFRLDSIENMQRVTGADRDRGPTGG